MDQVNNVQFSILKAISQGSNSASIIAKETDLSLPYTLSQLQLLEAKNIIHIEKKQRQSSPGKPKKIYGISKTNLNIKFISKDLVTQVDLATKPMQTYTQLLLSLPSEKQHALSEYYWTNFHFIKEVQAFGFIEVGQKRVELIALTTHEHLDRLRSRISNFTSNDQTEFVCWVHTNDEIIKGFKEGDAYYKNIKKKIKALVDPHSLIKEVRELSHE